MLPARPCRRPARPPGRPPARPTPCRSAQLRACLAVSQRPVARAPSACPCRIATQLPALRHRQPCLLLLHITIQFVLQYKLPSQPNSLSHNTEIVLQYNFNSLLSHLLQYKLSLAIHFFQPNKPLSCNTINCIAIQFGQ